VALLCLCVGCLFGNGRCLCSGYILRGRERYCEGAL
jgi:hypothetical protein